MRIITNNFDCATPINWNCWLNRGLIGDFSYVPGLYNPYAKDKTAMVGGAIYNLAALPGFQGRDGYSDAGTGAIQGRHAGNIGGWWAGPNRPGGFGKTWDNTPAVAGWSSPQHLWSTSHPFQFGSAIPFSGFAWVYFTSTSSAGIMHSAQSGAGFSGWQFNASIGGALKVGFKTFSLDVSSAITSLRGVALSSALVINKWYHLGFSYDGSNTSAGCTIYVNGQSAATTVLGDVGTPPSPFTDVNPQIWHDAGNLLGYGDQVRIYSRQVRPVEALELYRESASGSPNLYNRITTYFLSTAVPPSLLFSEGDDLLYAARTNW